MPISFRKYVAIDSSVGGAAAVAQRDLMLRLISTNPSIPTGSFLEFSSLEAVAAYFGTTDDEYLEAVFYFGFISKLSTTPSNISYVHWAETATFPLVEGIRATYTLADFQAISDGSMTLTLGSIVQDITLINLSGATDLANVATLLQAAIVLANADPQFTGCSVTFNVTEQRFDFVGGGPAGVAAMNVTPGSTGTQLPPVLGWVQPGAVFSDGADLQSITDVLSESTQASNNFGSFAFIPTLDSAQILEAATWNHGQNVTFVYLERVLDVDATSLVDSIKDFSGTSLTLYDGTLVPVQYPWLLPGAILSATPYFRPLSVQNYMYQTHAALTPTVTDTTLSDFYDSLRINYYGETQQAGNQIAFYQRGFMMGDVNAPTDLGVYTNEIFMKDSIGVSLLNLFLAVSAVPATDSGIAQVLAVVQASIDQALFNGTISVGKTLDTTQRAYIDQVTGDDLAYLQIQGAGYWITAVILEPTSGEFVVSYLLLYSKADAVRKVEGSHTLI